MIAAAIMKENSEILIKNVLVNPLRMGFIEAAIKMGANISLENIRDLQGEKVADIRAKSSCLNGIHISKDKVTSMIDEIPILSIVAAYSNGITKIEGLSELKSKESDRLYLIAKYLEKCGVNVKLDYELSSLEIIGCSRLIPGGITVDPSFDHRIAMSFLILGIVSKKSITVKNIEFIATSFPLFIDIINKIGGEIIVDQ